MCSQAPPPPSFHRGLSHAGEAIEFVKVDLTGTFEEHSHLSSAWEADLNRLCKSFNGQLFEDGDVIIQQGDMCEDEEGGGQFYVIVTGSVDVYVQRDGGDVETSIDSNGSDGGVSADALDLGRVVSTLTSGDYFGEIALLQSKPRNASCVANGPVEVLTLNRSNFCSELIGESALLSSLTSRVQIYSGVSGSHETVLALTRHVSSFQSHLNIGVR